MSNTNPLDAALKKSFDVATNELIKFANSEENINKISKTSEKLASIFESGRKLLTCGNGGSACDAIHCAEEFTGRYRKNRRALPAIALTDPGYLTCVANDFGYENVFARGVEAFGQSGDMLIVLTTSGNSENIIRAVNQAKKQHVYTVGLLGKDGGKLKGVCDVEWIIPGQTADRIQEVHMTLLHILIEGVERVLFPDQY